MCCCFLSGRKVSSTFSFCKWEQKPVLCLAVVSILRSFLKLLQRPRTTFFPEFSSSLRSSPLTQLSEGIGNLGRIIPSSLRFYVLFRVGKGLGLFPLGGPGLEGVSAVRFSAPHASTLALALQPALCGGGGGIRTPPRRIVYFSRSGSCIYFTHPIFKLFCKESLNLHEHRFLLPLPPPKKKPPSSTTFRALRTGPR